MSQGWEGQQQAQSGQYSPYRRGFSDEDGEWRGANLSGGATSSVSQTLDEEVALGQESHRSSFREDNDLGSMKVTLAVNANNNVVVRQPSNLSNKSFPKVTV